MEKRREREQVTQVTQVTQTTDPERCADSMPVIQATAGMGTDASSSTPGTIPQIYHPGHQEQHLAVEK